MSNDHEIDIGGAPEQNIQQSPKGLSSSEVPNLNNVPKSAGDDEQGNDSLVNEVASDTAPTEAIARRWTGTGRPPMDADPGEPNLVFCEEDAEEDGEEECYFKMRSEEEIHRAAQELGDKVWYYRKEHLVSAVERREESIPPDDIANRMFAEMRRIKQEYGEANLGPLTDWEWGYLNGKLSAIRWAQGLEWDNLDT
jgi:hypothetical protein